jgi:hypothetical protein
MLRRRSSPRLFFEIDDAELLPVVVFDNAGSADVFDGTEYREAVLRRYFALQCTIHLMPTQSIASGRSVCVA